MYKRRQGIDQHKGFSNFNGINRFSKTGAVHCLLPLSPSKGCIHVFSSHYAKKLLVDGVVACYNATHN
jgi:hypothetical protein